MTARAGRLSPTAVIGAVLLAVAVLASVLAPLLSSRATR